jgi:hypothetical protein
MRKQSMYPSRSLLALPFAALLLFLTTDARGVQGQEDPKSAVNRPFSARLDDREAGAKSTTEALAKKPGQKELEEIEKRAVREGFSPAVVEKLSQDQLYNLMQRKIHSRGVPEGIVPIIVPIVFFLTLLGAVVAILVYRGRKDKELQITLRAMVEKGADIPAELIAPPQKRSNDRKKGILLLTGGLGLSLCLAFIAIGNPEAIRGAGVGLIPILLGIGYLIVAKMQGGEDEKGERAGEPASQQRDDRVA